MSYFEIYMDKIRDLLDSKITLHFYYFEVVNCEIAAKLIN